jgi:hypothetical protein
MPHRPSAGETDPIQPWQTIAGGLLAVGAGMLLILRGLGVITEGRIYAPPWVIVVAGLVFLAPGLFYLYFGARALITPGYLAGKKGQFEFAGAGVVLFVVVMTLFAVLTTAAAVCSWLPEYAAGFESNMPGGIAWARVGFAVGALILDAIVLFFWGGVLGELARRRRSFPTRPAEDPEP